MKRIPIENLESDIDLLKSYISQFNEYSVFQYIAHIINSSKSLIEETELSSPYKQLLYLCALCLSTENVENRDFNKEDFIIVKPYLQRIVEYYMRSFFPPEGKNKSELTEQWWKDREISMPAFLNYFNTTNLAYPEQIIQRVRRWFLAYSDIIESELGFRVEDAILIFEEIGKIIQDNLDQFSIYSKEFDRAQDVLIASMSGIDFNYKNIRKKSDKLGLTTVADKYLQSMNNLYTISRKQIQSCSIEQVDAFFNYFSVNRKKRKFRYFAKRSFLEESPLLYNDGNVLVAFYKQVINAIYSSFFNLLKNSEVPEKFLRHRDKQVEEETFELFQMINHLEGNVYLNLFETSKLQNEHDLIWIIDDKLVLIECKATVVKEPFRDPEKASLRIRDHFKGNIQKGYDQALRLKTKIIEEETVFLYDNNGNVVTKLDHSKFKGIYIIIVTAESFGPLAIDTSIILEKPSHEPAPWCCNLYDLELIFEAFRYLNYEIQDFFNYLDNRSTFHEKFICSDELELAGLFFENNKFQNNFSKDFDKIALTYDMSNVFDEIYYKKKRGY